MMKPDVKTAAGKQKTDHELRCECGSLVAKLVRAGIELKCRRCKRLAVIPLDKLQDRSRTVDLSLIKA